VGLAVKRSPHRKRNDIARHWRGLAFCFALVAALAWCAANINPSDILGR
jgi:hypothetical protein